MVTWRHTSAMMVACCSTAMLGALRERSSGAAMRRSDAGHLRHQADPDDRCSRAHKTRWPRSQCCCARLLCRRCRGAGRPRWRQRYARHTHYRRSARSRRCSPRPTGRRCEDGARDRPGDELRRLADRRSRLSGCAAAARTRGRTAQVQAAYDDTWPGARVGGRAGRRLGDAASADPMGWSARSHDPDSRRSSAGQTAFGLQRQRSRPPRSRPPTSPASNDWELDR